MKISLLQLKGGTAVALTAANPVLADREPCLETDTGKIKYGPGAWNTLPYSTLSQADTDAMYEPLGAAENYTDLSLQPTIDLINNTVMPAYQGTYLNDVNGAVVLDLSNGAMMRHLQLTGNITSFDIQNPPPTGSYFEAVVVFEQDGTGGRTVGGFTGNVDPTSGASVAALLNTGSRRINIVKFVYWADDSSTGGRWFAIPIAVGANALTSPATIPTVPNAPQVSKPSGSPSGQITAMADVPDGNGSPVTSMQFDVLSNGSVAASMTVNVTGTDTSESVTFTGLTDGNQYYVRVNATNSVGTSGWSSLSTAVTPGAGAVTAIDPKTGFPPQGIACRLGASMNRTGEDKYTTSVRIEGSMGRQLGACRFYFQMGDSWFGTSSPEYKLLSHVVGKPNRLGAVSVNMGSKTQTWQTIANGANDAQITSMGMQYANFQKLGNYVPMLIDWDHEPESVSRGTGADFCQAWTHCTRVFLDAVTANGGDTSYIQPAICSMSSCFIGDANGYATAPDGRTYYDSTATDPLKTSVTMGALIKVFLVDCYDKYGQAKTSGSPPSLPSQRQPYTIDQLLGGEVWSSGKPVLNSWYDWVTKGDRLDPNTGLPRLLGIGECGAWDPAGGDYIKNGVTKHVPPGFPLTRAQWLAWFKQACAVMPYLGLIMYWSHPFSLTPVSQLNYQLDLMDDNVTVNQDSLNGWVTISNDPYFFPESGVAGAALSISVNGGNSIVAPANTGQLFVQIPASGSYSAGDSLTGVVYYNQTADHLDYGTTGLTAVGARVALSTSLWMQAVQKTLVSDETTAAGTGASAGRYVLTMRDASNNPVSGIISMVYTVVPRAKSATATYGAATVMDVALIAPSVTASANDIAITYYGGYARNFIAHAQNDTMTTPSTSLIVEAANIGYMQRQVNRLIDIGTSAGLHVTGAKVLSVNVSTNTVTLDAAYSWAANDMVVPHDTSGTPNGGVQLTPFMAPNTLTKPSGIGTTTNRGWGARNVGSGGAYQQAGSAGALGPWTVNPNNYVPGDYGAVTFLLKSS